MSRTESGTMLHLPSVAWAIIPAKLSTKPSRRLSPVPPLLPASPMVEAAMAGATLLATPPRPGKRLPTSLVTLGNVFWKRPPLWLLK